MPSSPKHWSRRKLSRQRQLVLALACILYFVYAYISSQDCTACVTDWLLHGRIVVSRECPATELDVIYISANGSDPLYSDARVRSVERLANTQFQGGAAKRKLEKMKKHQQEHGELDHLSDPF